MRLNNDTLRITEEFGLDPTENLLFTNIRRDSSKIVKPIVAEVEGQSILLVRQQESGGVLAANIPAERVRFHTGWVTFDRRLVEGFDVAPNLPSLIAELSKGEQVQVAPGICLAHLQEFQDHKGVSIAVEEDPLDSLPVTVYRFAVASVLEQFAGWRAAGVEFGLDFVKKFPGLEGIDAYLDSNVDTRFSELAAVATDLGASALYLSAPPNFSEVTGFQDGEGLGALWEPGSESVFVIASDDARAIGGEPVARYASRAHAIRTLVTGPGLAVEEDWITASFAQTLIAAGFELRNASTPLGNWRDLRDVEDLVFQIIAARASTSAIEGALENLSQRLADGGESTEYEVYSDYLDGLQKFRVQYEVPFAIEPYFTNLHASDRTLFPTPPAAARITAASRCIELDAGVKITVNGVVLATSDMARTLTLTPGATRAFRVLTDVIRESIIPSIRPGVPVSEVHSQALTSLTAVRVELEDAGVLDPQTDFVSWYKKRNVGHLMGKQESFANELRPGYSHVLRVGDYGAAETPWRFGNVGISTEDLWFIGEERTFILTLS
ncbi:hypothetical protein ACI1US_00664 [Leucobacter sp. BZR 635]